MDSYRLLLVSGSLRTGSVNSAVATTVAALSPRGVAAEVYRGLGNLPWFSPDGDRLPLHPAVADLRDRLHGCDAVLFSTPEYAGALPGAFKNLLDWTVGDGLYEKPVGWVNASALHGAQAAHASLRTVLGYVNADIVEEACVAIPVPRAAYGPDLLISDPQIRAGLAAVVTALVRRVAEVRRRD
jgi:NAD(P)H-dependent FMN reductase